MMNECRLCHLSFCCMLSKLWLHLCSICNIEILQFFLSLFSLLELLFHNILTWCYKYPQWAEPTTTFFSVEVKLAGQLERYVKGFAFEDFCSRDLDLVFLRRYIESHHSWCASFEKYNYTSGLHGDCENCDWASWAALRFHHDSVI